MFRTGCGVALALTAFSAAADPGNELARLREEAAAHRQTLEAIETRIGLLERKGGNSAAREGGSSSLVQLKQSWSQVKEGMPEDRVLELLGKPEKVLRIDGTLVWYYLYTGIGRGSVFFNAGRKVSSLQSPSLGW